MFTENGVMCNTQFIWLRIDAIVKDTAGIEDCFSEFRKCKHWRWYINESLSETYLSLLTMTAIFLQPTNVSMLFLIACFKTKWAQFVNREKMDLWVGVAT